MGIEIENCNDNIPSLSRDHISDEERKHLISELHRLLVWVGEQLPETIDVNGKTIDVHETVWWCIHKKEFSEQEKQIFGKIIRLLEAKEKYYEEKLQTANLTHEEAEKLYHNIASIIRAIIDIRECETGKVKLKESNGGTKQKIDDAKRWMNFLKNIGRKCDL